MHNDFRNARSIAFDNAFEMCRDSSATTRGREKKEEGEKSCKSLEEKYIRTDTLPEEVLKEIA